MVISLKSFLLGGIALVASGSATAADFEGYYGGLSLGLASAKSKATSTIPVAPSGFAFGTGYIHWPDQADTFNSVGDQTISATGATLAGVIGHNWVSGNRLIGFEADFGPFSSSGSEQKSGTYPPHNTFLDNKALTIQSEARTEWLLTVRGRYGWISSNSLYYVTGGLAVMQLSGSFRYSDEAGGTESANFSDLAPGVTLGFGIERPAWGRWSVKAEYLYAHFAKVEATGGTRDPGGGVPSTVTHGMELQTHMLRAGLNYKF